MSDDQAFSGVQQNFLKGFMAGVEARRGSLSPGGGGAPPDALRAAQDRALAEGGKLTPEEEAKRAKHPLDRWDELTARAAEGKFPKGVDVLLTKYHGLFYVAPAQDSFMCRLRIPGGIINAYQLRGVADIADELGGGYADVTTRANLQIREIPAAKGPELVMRLGEIGLLPRGTGADNVRNITAAPTAGLDAAELIDTRPIVRAIHHHILTTRDLFGLPRKFNIALDGGGRVAVLEDTNDIAFTAALLDGVPTFRLGLGGITGHRDFARETGVVVAPADVVAVCDAILRVFVAHGDRTDRKKARLKYLLDRWGLEKFLAEVEAQWGRGFTRFEPGALVPPQPAVKHAHVGVHAQRQEGQFYVGVVVPIGRLTTERLRGLADIATRFGNGELRLTVWQNLLIPNVAESAVEAVCEAVRALGLATEASAIRGGLIACTGNAGCKFAASNTKGHAAMIGDFLEARIALDQPINIHLTGCHHSCAQHYIADIGLLGARVEVGEDSVEGYDLHVGGGAGPEQAIGRLIKTAIVAEDVPPAILALLRRWVAERADGESFQAYSARHEDAALLAMIGESAEVMA